MVRALRLPAWSTAWTVYCADTRPGMPGGQESR